MYANVIYIVPRNVGDMVNRRDTTLVGDGDGSCVLTGVGACVGAKVGHERFTSSNVNNGKERFVLTIRASKVHSGDGYTDVAVSITTDNGRVSPAETNKHALQNKLHGILDG